MSSERVPPLLPPCIYCGKPADGKEHWVPAWLGSFRGVDTLRERLCGACNGELGRTVDMGMSRTGPEALDRYRYQIAGRETDWSKANPFYYGTQGMDSPTVATVAFPDRDHELMMEDIPSASGKPERVPMRQIVVRAQDGTAHAVPLPAGVTGGWLRKALERKSLLGSQLEEIICDGEGRYRLPEPVREALLACFPEAKNIKLLLQGRGDRVVLPSQTRVGISLEYVRGVAKLGLHSLLALRPEIDGRDESFGPIRDFIRHGRGAPGDFVALDASPFLIGPVGADPEDDGHFLMVEVSADQIRVHLSTFVQSPYGRRPTMVIIGSTPATVTTRRVSGHLLRLYPEGERDGYIGELVSRRTQFFKGRWGVLTS